MATSRPTPTPGSERIPFYRNVKTIGLLAQIVFAVVLVGAIYIVYHNVTTALAGSDIPADFGFLGNRAGVPIAESVIRYSPNDSYARAFLIGILNTLKVALVGVLAASILGIAIGVMRLSRNYVMRQLATIYVETLRNTPLAVQIVFWYTAILTPLPPRTLNASMAPGGILLSNQGIALPWAYPSYHFQALLPVILLAVVVGLATWWWRRRQLTRADRPGNAAGPGWLALLVVLAIGYLAVGRGPLPEGATTSFRAASGVVTVFRDLDGNGVKNGSEPFLPYAKVDATVPQGQLDVQTQDLVESRRLVYSTFRFPILRPSDADRFDVAFADPKQAEAQNLHIAFRRFPSRGVVYQDRNGNGQFDAGEEVVKEAGGTQHGFRTALVMTVEGFHWRLVTDRYGGARIPRFKAEGGNGGSQSGGTNMSPAQLFSKPAASPAAALTADFVLQKARPLVWSVPRVPISTYVGGIELTTNYLALLVALIVYTASFIAEIVRGGLQAVAIGQTEAAKALGLSDAQTFRLIVFPQALRIILPPMISQYLNLTKNSSLAPLAAYAELFAISVIIANQTGASVPVTIMLIAAYVAISLVFAFALNIVNARIALVER